MMQKPVSSLPVVGRAIAFAGSGTPIRLFAYVSDTSAVATAAVLFDQKQTIDEYASERMLHIERYVVDSGMVFDAAYIAFNLRDLLAAAHQGKVDAIVIEHVSRFAADYALSLRIAAAFSMWGVTIHEARGGLIVVEPEIATMLADTLETITVAGPFVHAGDLCSGPCH